MYTVKSVHTFLHFSMFTLRMRVCSLSQHFERPVATITFTGTFNFMCMTLSFHEITLTWHHCQFYCTFFLFKLMLLLNSFVTQFNAELKLMRSYSHCVIVVIIPTIYDVIFQKLPFKSGQFNYTVCW